MKTVYDATPPLEVTDRTDCLCGDPEVPLARETTLIPQPVDLLDPKFTSGGEWRVRLLQYDDIQQNIVYTNRNQ